MKQCKRILAILLSVVLCCTVLPVSTLAAEDWPEKDDPIEAFFTTGSIGSAEGSGKLPAYNETDRTTWALSDALGMSVPFTDNIPPFTDSISDWAYDDVARISNANIMTGTSDTTFDAKAGFTIEQSIVSLIRLEMYVR